MLFERTFDYIKNSELNYLHIFPYSDRKGTKASMRNDKISDYEKKKDQIAQIIKLRFEE